MASDQNFSLDAFVMMKVVTNVQVQLPKRLKNLK